MAGFRIREDKPDGRLYAGPDIGWVQGKPQPPPDPDTQAVTYQTKEDAQKAIAQHGMKAVVEDAP